LKTYLVISPPQVTVDIKLVLLFTDLERNHVGGDIGYVSYICDLGWGSTQVQSTNRTLGVF
jgi:hypothetical protein